MEKQDIKSLFRASFFWDGDQHAAYVIARGLTAGKE